MDKIVELRKEKDAGAPQGGEALPPRLQAERGRRGGSVRLVLGLVAVAAVGLAAWPWLAARWTHVAIDDARVAANLVTVSSEVSGRITSVPVIVGDRVTEGQLLATIDSEQTGLELKALDAQIAGMDSQQDQLRAQQEMVRVQVGARLAAGRTQVAAAEAAHRASEAALANARSRFDRVSRLAESNVTSEQAREEAQAALTAAQEQERVAAAGIDTAKANVEVAQAETAQIAVIERQIATLEAQKGSLAAQREQKRVDLARREIRAGFDGVVDGTFVDAGEYVAPGTRLLIYHDPGVVWIDANVKETDFNRVKLGAPAAVTVDAYPSIAFRGEVARLGEAATSQFALLPSPNPSGNFTKITQRLPIRIAIDQKDGLLRPGMMAEVSVDVVD